MEQVIAAARYQCPKCGKSMTLGALDPNAKGALFWAPEAYCATKVCNFFTEGDALKNGGIRIPAGNGITQNRTRAWGCEECKFVLIDCN